MTTELSLPEMQKKWHGTYKAYAIGFFSSLLLTAISFSLVLSKVFSGQVLIYAITALAIAQAIIQLFFFLHVGQEEKPRWETLVFYFMVLVLLIVAFGSLWVMYDLNARMMPMEHASNNSKAMIHD